MFKNDLYAHRNGKRSRTVDRPDQSTSDLPDDAFERRHSRTFSSRSRTSPPSKLFEQIVAQSRLVSAGKSLATADENVSIRTTISQHDRHDDGRQLEQSRALVRLYRSAGEHRLRSLQHSGPRPSPAEFER